jgi:hypothetical protein
MISLTCTHCKAVLTMDDAFAGGACRCHHCGTIQTVPVKLKGSAKNPATGKALYRNKARDGSGTGLDDLADAVLSSGLASMRLRQRAVSRTRFMLAFFGTIAFIVILAGTVVYLAIRPKPASNTNMSASPESPAVSAGSVTANVSGAPNPAAPKSPNFCGIPLDGQTTIYVLDRGDSTRDIFGDLKQACYRSIATLGPQRKFQVIFWNNGSDDAFPSGSPAFATNDNIEAAKRTLDDIAPHGKTDITSAFKKAVAANPSTIVIATAKAWDLDDNFVTLIQTLRGSSSAKIHTIALSDPGASTALKRIAGNNGGVFRVVGEGDLKEFGQ